MRNGNRQAARVLGLMLICAHIFLCIGCGIGLSTAQPSALGAVQHAGIAFDIVQIEQSADFAVKSNSNPYRHPNSPLTLKQTFHFLTVALSLFLPVIIGAYAVYPIKRNRISIVISSWHLLRAPPKKA